MDHETNPIIAQDRGLIGTATLYADCLVIERNEVLCELHRWLGGDGLFEISRIELNRITGLGLISSLLLPRFLMVRYAGCSQISGNALSDAFLENVHVLSLFDQRSFHTLYTKLREQVSIAQSHPMAPEPVVEDLSDSNASGHLSGQSSERPV